MAVRALSTWTSRSFFPVAAALLVALAVVFVIEPTRPEPGADGVVVLAADAESTPHTHAAGDTHDETMHDGAAHDDGLHDGVAHDSTQTTSAAHLHTIGTGTGTGTGIDSTHDHDHGTPGGPMPTGPIVSVDDPRLTPAQQQAARTLRDRTRATIATVPNAAALTAAGYRSAGDSSYGLSHWVKDALTNDGRELDTSRIEVFMVHIASGRTIGAMYMLEPGKTMASVPDIAGELTTWHDHDPMCFSSTDRWHFVSFAKGTNCPAGSEYRIVPPMMHVWLEEQPCGPFVGTEGHGSTSCGSHAH